MTQITITLGQGRLLSITLLYSSLRESLLRKETFPIIKHIFPVVVLSVSEGLSHKIKWGVDDRPWMTLWTTFHPVWKTGVTIKIQLSNKVFWPSVLPAHKYYLCFTKKCLCRQYCRHSKIHLSSFFLYSKSSVWVKTWWPGLQLGSQHWLSYL